MTTYERPQDYRRTSMPEPAPPQPRQRSSISRASMSQGYVPQVPNYDPNIPQQYLSPDPASRRLSVPSASYGPQAPPPPQAAPLPYPTSQPQYAQQPPYQRPQLSPQQAYPANPPYAQGPQSPQPYPLQTTPAPTGYFDPVPRSPQQRSPVASPHTRSPNLHPSSAAYEGAVTFDEAAYAYGGNGYSQRPRGYSTGSYPPPQRHRSRSRSTDSESRDEEHRARRRHSNVSTRRRSSHGHIDEDGRKHYHRKDKRPTYGDSVMLASDTIMEVFDRGVDSVKDFFSSKRT